MPRLGPEYDDPRGVADSGVARSGAAAATGAGASGGAAAASAVGNRGTENRFGFPENPETEDVGATPDAAVMTRGCDKLPDFPPSDELSDGEIQRLWKLTGMYYTPGFDGTPCMIKAARSIQGNLLAVARKNITIYFKLLQQLVDIRDEIKLRTEKPYKLAFDTRYRKALPKEILNYPPFSEYGKWVENLKAHKLGNAVVLEPIPLVEKTEKISEQPDQQSQLDLVLEKIDRAVVDLQLTQRGLDDTPIVKKALAALHDLTLKKVKQQTGVVINPAFEDQPIIMQTELILYHSVYSVVLDKTGEPFDVQGRLYYPILCPDPGSVMERHIEPPGLYVSLKRFGDGNFWVGMGNGKVRKILFGGIGGFVENYGGGVRAPHEFQETLQNYINDLGYAYAASVSTPAAFSSADVTLGLLSDKLPGLAEAAVPYMVREIEKLGKHDYDNWEDLAKDIGKEVVKQIIIEKVKEKIRDYLIKKIGAKVIPLLNMASALYDAFTGEAERRRVRNIIACILLHVKGSGQDDLHIAAKVLGKILADKFHDDIIAAITSRAAHLGAKAVKRGKGKAKGGDAPADSGQPDKPWEEEPDDDTDLSKTLSPKKPAADPAAAETSPPEDPHGTNGKGTDPKNRGVDLQATQKELQDAQDLANRLKASQGQGQAQPAPAQPPAQPSAQAPAPSQPAASPAPAKPPVKAPKEDEENDRETVSNKQKKKKPAEEGEDEGEEEPENAKAGKRGTDDDGTEDKGTQANGARAEAKKQAAKKKDRGKKIGFMSRTKAKWGDRARAIWDAVSRRGKLRESFDDPDPNLFAHHLIPVTVLKTNEVAQAAVVGGFDFNGRANGKLLRGKEHEGGHNEYNAIIDSELNRFADEHPGYTPAEARAFVEKSVSRWSDNYDEVHTF